MKKKKIVVSVKKTLKKEEPKKQAEKLTEKIVNKAMSFDQMYKQVIKCKKKNKCETLPTVVYDSKQSTPLPSYRAQSQRQKNNQQNIKQNRRQQNFFDKIIHNLDHIAHTHIRNNECFLCGQEVVYVLSMLNYTYQLQYYSKQILYNLELQTYGGIPSQNLKQFLEIIEGKNLNKISATAQQQNIYTSIIDSNLKLDISQEDKITLYNFYSPFRNGKSQSQRSMSFEEMYQNKKNQQQNVQDLIQLRNKLNQALQKSNKQNKQIDDTDKTQPSNSKPILSVDIGLGEGVNEKIVVYEGQTAKRVSQRLSQKLSLSVESKQKFEKMLSNHLNKILQKIQEVSQDIMTERDQQF